VFILLSLLAPPPARPEESGRIIYASGDHNYPPYEYTGPDGRPAGFNVDVFRAVCEIMNIPFRLELGPWEEVRQDLETGRIDVLTGMYFSEKRDIKVDFTSPHIVVSHTFFIRKKSPEISLETLENRRILVQQGDIMHDILREQPGDFRIIPVTDQIDALQLLAVGRHDGALLAKLQGHYLMEQNGIRNLVSSGPPVYPRDYCFAVTEGDGELLIRLNEGLAILKSSGQYREIYEKWFGRYEKQAIWTQVLLNMLWILTPLLLLFLAVVIWNRSLKRRVNAATREIQEELVHRKIAEREALDKETKLRIILDSIGDGVIAVDRESRIMRLNPVAARLTGISPSEAAGRPLKDVFRIYNALTGEDAENPVEKVLNSGQVVELSNHTVMRSSDGGEYQIADSGAPIRDDKGNITGVVLVFRDVTREYRMRQDLSIAKSYIDNIINSMPSLLVGVDEEMRITLWNEQAARETGLASRKVQGQSLMDVLPRLKPELPGLKNVINDGTLHKTESAVREQDGQLRYEDITVYPLSGRDTVGAVIRIDDITERISLEEQLAQSRKMDAVGQLAGGIAHDFNNMLGGILGAADLLALSIPEGERELLEIIRQAAVNASDLTSRLMNFSREKRLTTGPEDIHLIIRNTLDLLERSIDKKIRISLEAGAEMAGVMGDGIRLQNVFLNLGLNAAQAMPGGGAFRIRTRNRLLEAPLSLEGEFEVPAGRQIEIELEDTGTGIDPENLKKIFDPFFTTREAGSGTGLGLASVYRTVRSHHGSVSVESEPGRGTVFTIRLPVSEELLHREPEHREAVHGAGCILLVDDEEIIRHTTRAILTDLDYRVITAENGREALRIYRERRDEIDLVLLDMVMPEMDGTETFDGLKEIDPEVRIIASSGYSKEKEIEELMSRGLTAFIRKPYGQAELSRLIAGATGPRTDQ